MLRNITHCPRGNGRGTQAGTSVIARTHRRVCARCVGLRGTAHGSAIGSGYGLLKSSAS